MLTFENSKYNIFFHMTIRHIDFHYSSYTELNNISQGILFISIYLEAFLSHLTIAHILFLQSASCIYAACLSRSWLIIFYVHYLSKKRDKLTLPESFCNLFCRHSPFIMCCSLKNKYIRYSPFFLLLVYQKKRFIN